MPTSISRPAIRFLVVLAVTTAVSGRAWSQVVIRAVVNAASFLSITDQSQFGGGATIVPSGGALATLFCSGITTNPGVFTAPSSTPLPFVLGGVRVKVNGALAPLLAVVIPPNGQAGAYAQINFQVPLERNSAPDEAAEENVAVSISSSDGFASSTILFAVRGAGGFFSDANGYAAAQHASDYSQVTVQNPAHAGETIIAYADDFFEVWPPSADRVSRPAATLVRVQLATR